MNLSTTADYLWGKRAKPGYLLLASTILIFTFLGGREIWTQEHRWSDIVYGMFYRHDFLHPYLGNTNYYDKPLLSYWLVAIFAKLAHGLTTWSLRMPSALAGLLCIWSIYRLGTKLKDRQLGLLAGWLLLTIYYFLFWSRTASADMLNLAGTLLAISWYFDKRDHASFFDYVIFFLILALTSLCKGLVGAIVPLIAVFTDIVLQKSWKQHLRLSMVFATIPAIVIYLLPFVASAYYADQAYEQNGLYLVYQENILRYFKPFDHQGPIYTYFIYLPIYLLPSLVLFIPALFSLQSRWKTLRKNSRWIILTLGVLFLFFTLSGSRRSYYVLPLVPFAILLTADWILSDAAAFAKKSAIAAGLIVTSLALLFLGIDLFPKWYYSKFGVEKFANSLKAEVSKVKPWNECNIVILDAESKLIFYSQLPPSVIKYHIKGSERHLLTEDQLLAEWPLLKSKPENTIFITRKFYQPLLNNILKNHYVFEIRYPNFVFLQSQDMEIPIAYIPYRL